MKTVLHLVTKQGDALAEDLIRRQQQLPDTTVKVLEMTAGVPDYDKVVRGIFEADSIEVW